MFKIYYSVFVSHPHLSAIHTFSRNELNQIKPLPNLGKISGDEIILMS